MNTPTAARKAASRRVKKTAAKGGEGPAGATPEMVHDLDASIPYLIARAGITTGQAFSGELKQFGLSLNEWRVCASLRFRPHQRLSDLAVNTSCDASTLSRTVDGLCSRGLLVRERSPDDARAVALRLTPDGNALTERVIPLARLYERVALAGIDPQQVQLLRELLHRIYDNMATLAGRE